jgi:hypothetical protein
MSKTAKNERVDLCNGACFGQQKIRRERKGKTTWSFKGDCTENERCRLNKECFSKSIQDYEEKHCGEKEMSLCVTGLIRTKEQFRYPDEDTISSDAIISETLGGFQITPDARAVLFEFARLLYELYVSKPVLFDVMIRKIFENKNISDVAKLKNETRQGVSAKLAREIAGMKPEKEKYKDSLRGLERSVYELCFEDGCTIRSAAQQLGISKDKVYRVRQKLSTKNKKNATKNAKTNKKLEKK